jgi:RNA polymerase sigma factor (sigma-70 family)
MGTRGVSTDMSGVMGRPDDDELWSAVGRGDAEAFGLLFERHSRSVYNYCFRRTGDWARAEDLTSVVFLECWRRREVSLEKDKVLPWLFGIATNVCRNQRRSLARHRAALKRLPSPEPTSEFVDGVLERLEDEDRMRDVLSVVSRLPKREQDVLALCVWADLSYEDAAAALRIPVGTVRSRLARARRRLRGELGEDGAAGGNGSLALADVSAQRGVKRDAD